MVVCRVEKTAVGGVAEMRQHGIHQFARGGKIPLIESGLVQRQQPVGKKGVIFQIAGQFGATILPRAPQPPVGRAQIFQQKIGVAAGDGSIFGIIQHAPGFGKCGEHHTVPRGENLFIAGGFHPLLPAVEQNFPAFRQFRRQRRLIHSE